MNINRNFLIYIFFYCSIFCIPIHAFSKVKKEDYPRASSEKNNGSCIGGSIWYDENRNGIFSDSNENGIYNVEVILIDLSTLNDSIIDLTKSDSLGFYSFDNVLPGNYRVELSANNWNIFSPLRGLQSTPTYFDPNINIDQDNNGFGALGGLDGPAYTDEILLDGINDFSISIDFALCDPVCVNPNDTPEHTLYDSCDNGTENDAESNPICSIWFLDSFCQTMPDRETASGFDPVCLDGLAGGVSHNLFWISFIATSPRIVFEVLPHDCIDGFGTGTGLQLGIYDSCPLDSAATALWCHGIPCAQGPQIIDNLNTSNLAASGIEYVPGEIYYFFVDGCNSSRCHLEINVLSAGSMYMIPEFESECTDCTEITENEEYSVCLGSSEITTQMLFADTFPSSLDLDYSWEVKPPFGLYQDSDGNGWGEHPSNNTSDKGLVQDWVWNEVGSFQIRSTIQYLCDSAVDTFNIYVEKNNVEIFDDLYFCESQLIDSFLTQNDYNLEVDAHYSVAISPWLEDPNQDGELGWMADGFDLTSFIDTNGITGPVIVSNIDTNSIGCFYDQEISLYMVNTVFSDPIDTAFCSGEFIIIQEDTIGFTANNFRLSPTTSLQTYCDSITRLNIKQLNLEGEIIQNNCKEGTVELVFDFDESSVDFILYDFNESGRPIEILPEDYLNEYLDSMTFKWTNTISDSLLSEEESVIIDSIGTIRLEVIIWANGVSCNHLFESIDINGEDLMIDPPTMVNSWSLEFCEHENKIAQYSIIEDSSYISYDWIVPADATLLNGQSTSSVDVDWTSSAGGVICVYVSSLCGSSQLCDTVIIQPMLSSNFSAVGEICVDETLIVEYNSNLIPGMQFNWDFDDGIILNNSDINGPGPFELTWNSSDTYPIKLITSLAGCSSTQTVKNIEVLSPPTEIEALNVWEISICENPDSTVVYAVSTDSILVDYSWTVPSDAFIQTGQGTNEITVEWANSLGGEICVTTSNSCGIQSFCENIISVPRPIAIFTEVHDICLDTSISIVFADTINPEMNFFWDFDNGIIQDSTFLNGPGPFDVSWLDPGQKNISLQVELNGCTSEIVIDSLFVGIEPISSFTYVKDSSMITFNSTSGGADSYFWDFGDGTTSNEENPSHTYQTIGNYMVTLIVSNNCGNSASSEEVSIDLLLKNNENAFSVDMKIYPNPSNNVFYIDFGENSDYEISIEIYTLNGQLILALPKSNDNLRIFDMSLFDQGVYFIKFNSNQSYHFRKIELIR